MDTAEIVVYLMIATIVGGLVLLMVGRFNEERTYDLIKNLFTGENDNSFAKTDENSTTAFIYNAWESCGLGTIDKNATFQYIGTQAMDRGMLFASIKTLRLCGTIQSASSGCGRQEDVVMDTLEPSRIYIASCNSNTRIMTIS